MLLPYSHKSAMAQTPVPYTMPDDSIIMLYPATVGMIQEFTVWLQARYTAQFAPLIASMPDDVRPGFFETLYNGIATFDVTTGIGYAFLQTDADAMSRYIYMLARQPVDWSEERIKTLLFSQGVTEYGLVHFTSIQMAVTRKLPESQPYPKTSKRKQREYTEEEAVVRVYRMLGEKYGWTYKQCLELTDYQIYWYLYMLPEEREQLEEMERMINESQSKMSDSQLPSGTMMNPNVIHFNTDEEYQAWLATRTPKP